MFESDGFKKIAAVVLILLTGGAWIYLDMWNEQEKQAAIQLHREMQQAGAQARSRVEIKSKFDHRCRYCACFMLLLCRYRRSRVLWVSGIYNCTAGRSAV